MKVELHILQNFPPANLNRDDTGTPKDCEFGGERRARISSQCIKRSIRTHPAFEATLGSQIAVRTRQSARRVAQLLVERHDVAPDTAQALAEAALSQLLSDVGDDGRTKVLYYAAPAELSDLAIRLHGEHDVDDAVSKGAQAVVKAQQELDKIDTEDKKAKKKAEKSVNDAWKKLKKAMKGVVKDFVKENQGRARSVDIALFGRMLAEQPKLNLEAACQVAHAISTNRVSMEFDFYTAVDDLNPKEETGAGMMGTTGYNSSCFYRYALIDVDQLARTLSPENEATDESRALARDGVKAFLKAAVAAIPTGKQNSFAAQTRPSLVLTVVRPDGSMPMSLVNAFEEPARPQTDHTTGRHISLVEDSIARLDQHWHNLNEMYGDDKYKAFLALLNGAGVIDHIVQHRVKSVPVLLEKTVSALSGEATS